MSKKTDDPKNKFSRLQEICQKINKGDWGGENKDALLFFGEGGSNQIEIEKFSTGSISLDWALGGGWPIGRIAEVYGPESVGKSTLVLHAISEFQKKFPNEYVALIDSEFSFDIFYAKSLGVDVDSIIINQPESGEQALNILEQLIDEGVKMIVVDSVAALTTQAELTSNIGDPQVAAQARLMSNALKKLVSKVSKAKAFVLFTNQMRDKIGVMGWGEKTTQPGGRALKFYASCRVALSAIGKDKEGDEIVSTRIKATVKKNKVAPPFREAIFVITFGKGIDRIAAAFEEAIALKIIKRSGAYYDVFGTRCQGKSEALEILKNNTDYIEQIEQKVRDKVSGKVKIEEIKEEVKEETEEKKVRRVPVSSLVLDDDNESIVESGE